MEKQHGHSLSEHDTLSDIEAAEWIKHARVVIKLQKKARRGVRKREMRGEEDEEVI